ncbi:ABC transporter permease [Legionella gresilensis]|uniref:ABC transporter permease n=1 Tax=Legionella gresilensis TaxID=91823 RepID=UPI001040EF28|nr:ABC transporter permease [Legionella gresilensis]
MNLAVLIFKNRRMLINLIKSDFKDRYLGHHLGIIWAFIQPLVMVAVYWFVFTHGFRISAVSNAPFLLWLLAGLVPWFLLNEAIISSSNAIVSQSFFVKKILFEVKLLPIVKVGSALLVNLIFLSFLICVCIAYGFYPNFWWLQLIYYMACIIAISLSLGLLISAIMPFWSDVGQILTVVMQVLFWATPIMWNKEMLGDNYWYFIKLNPFAYIIEGYRTTIINHLPFWHNYDQMIYFWLFVLVSAYLGNIAFNKLRPHFADVL